MQRNRPKTFADSIRLPLAGGSVTRLITSGGDIPVVTIRVGRASGGTLTIAAASRLGIREGAAWTGELRAAVLAELARQKGAEYALRIAAARPLTRRQVQDKLVQRGMTFDAARAIAEDLALRGVIDEKSLAEHVASGAMGRPRMGKSVVVMKLRRRGVDAKTAQRAADQAEADSGVDPREVAMELARRRVRTLPKGLDARGAQRRVYAFLARRGFDPETCMAAAKQALQGRSADDIE